ncbi:MAG: adenosine deaminase [Gemmatimonadota bacterium]|nr:adenosine deaminase [Gemmatimonadota bacterium]
MAEILRDLLVRLPKAELHCHLDGSVRPQTLIDLAAERDVTLPAHNAAELQEYMVVQNADNLEDYLSRFSVTLSVMQDAEALERIAHELVVDAAHEGIRYIEIRYSPVLNTQSGLSLDEAVEAPLRGISSATFETGTVGRLIICALRHLEPAVSSELARLAVAYKHHGVVGFDLAGGERDHPASTHVESFAYARSHDLAVTVHAGEGDGADSVRQAVHICGANRLGHATRLFEDHSLMQYVNDRQIALEICLTSNVQTRAVTSYATHPLRAYFEQGQLIVLNTDNRLMSGVTLTDEYAHAASSLGFTFAELAQVARSGFESAFASWQERRSMLDAFDRELPTLLARS